MSNSENQRLRGICLVGFMGAGKTSVGQALARQLGWEFTDLDDVVEARAHCRIPEIFRQGGEPAFRDAEKAALQAFLANLHAQPVVLAVGGGAYVQPENARALRCAALRTVFLDAPAEELRRRCGQKGADRPLFGDENQFRHLHDARRTSYLKADLCIDTAGLTVEQVAAELAKRLGLEET